MSVLVTGATGMFGGLITEKLSQAGVPVLAMSRSESRAAGLTGGSVTGVVADMDKPETFKPALEQADRMFLVSPMHPDLGARECAIIEQATKAGVHQIVKLYGSVDHDGDPLDRQHRMSIDALKDCGVPWCLVSPQTVTDSHILAQLETIRSERRLYACAGEGRMGMVTADNCAEVGAFVLQEAAERFAGRDLQITGPEAITYAQMAQQLTSALGVTIEYIDMTEEELTQAVVEAGMPEEDIELQILCHFRQIRNGKAELVTDTYQEIIGRSAASVHDWACANQGILE